MTERSVTHSTFTIERTYDAAPARVFKAFSDPKAKRRWFAEGEGWKTDRYELDFKVGGYEGGVFRFGDGPAIRNDTWYQDIVQDQRIIYAYTMMIGENRISASLATAEFKPSGKDTLLVYTEQGAFLDGHDNAAARESGMKELLELLNKEVSRGWMVGRSTAFGTFVIERRYDATPARTFRAWASPEDKARWFIGPGWTEIERSHDFRIGGMERLKGEFVNGRTSAFSARYLDIVPDRRIVYAYDIRLNDVFISSSLATIELQAAGSGTLLRFTEQGVFVDGYDDGGSREQGTKILLDQLGGFLSAN